MLHSNKFFIEHDTLSCKSLTFAMSILIPKAPMGRGWADVYIIREIMKKLLIILALALSSSMSMFADFSNRGRYSDFTDHKSSILDILPILIFIGIVGIFLYYGAKEYWSKHKDSIVGNLTLIGTGILFVLFLRFGLKLLLSGKTQKSIKILPEAP